MFMCTHIRVLSCMISLSLSLSRSLSLCLSLFLSSCLCGIRLGPRTRLGLGISGPESTVGPADNSKVSEPSGSCESIRVVKLVSTQPFSHHNRLSGYEME